jgi:hypothetical protein
MRNNTASDGLAGQDGINNTCFMAPLGEGVVTYGEIYKCGNVIAE